MFGFSTQHQMIVQDKLVKELNDAKNAVEEYVYDLRDKLCGIYEKYITEEVSAAFLHTVDVPSNLCTTVLLNICFMFCH